MIKGSFYSNRFSLFLSLFLGKFVVTLYFSSEDQRERSSPSEISTNHYLNFK